MMTETTDNVVQLSSKKEQEGDAIVKQLARSVNAILERHPEKRLSGFSIVAIFEDQSALDILSETSDPYRLIGVMEASQRRLLDKAG